MTENTKNTLMTTDVIHMLTDIVSKNGDMPFAFLNEDIDYGFTYTQPADDNTIVKVLENNIVIGDRNDFAIYRGLMDD